MCILPCGPAQEGRAGKGLCEGDKGMRNPNPNPVSESKPSGTGRERAHVGPAEGCSPIKAEEVMRECP